MEMKALSFTATIKFNPVTADDMTPEQWVDWFASFIPSASFPLADGEVEVVVEDWGITDEQITDQ
jgi:hypothetical protein